MWSSTLGHVSERAPSPICLPPSLGLLAHSSAAGGSSSGKASAALEHFPPTDLVRTEHQVGKLTWSLPLPCSCANPCMQSPCSAPLLLAVSMSSFPTEALSALLGLHEKGGSAFHRLPTCPLGGCACEQRGHGGERHPCPYLCSSRIWEWAEQSFCDAWTSLPSLSPRASRWSVLTFICLFVVCIWYRKPGVLKCSDTNS